MKIAPLFQMMNQSTNPIRTKSNSGSMSFSHFLISDHGVKELPGVNKKEASSEKISFQQITDELSLLVSELSLHQEGIKSSVVQEDMEETNSSTISLLENEISDIFIESNSVEEVINQVKSSPTSVRVLSLIKSIENISADRKVDFSPLVSKLNSMLDQEYPSYNNPKPIQFSSMIQAIENMKSNDRTLLEGEILLGKWIASENASTLLNVDKLFNINNKLSTEIKRMPMQEAQVKKDILNDLLGVTSNNKIENSLQAFLRKADLTTIQSIFHKTVESLFGEEITNIQLNHFVNIDHNMSVDVRDSPKENVLKDEQQNGMNKLLSVQEKLVEGLQQVSKIESIKESKAGQNYISDPNKDIEAIVSFLTENTGIDLTLIAKEITSLLNQYLRSSNEVLNEVMKNDDTIQIEKNLIVDFIGGMKLINQVQGVDSTNDNSIFTQIQPNQTYSKLKTELNDLKQIIIDSPLDIIREPSGEMPMIFNLLTLATTAEQVAKELSIDVSDVLSEIEKQIQANMSLAGTVSKDRQLSNRFTQHNDFLRKEITRPIAPLITGVQALVKGIELLSSQHSIDVTDIISKVESSLQAELLELKQLSPKGTLFENIPVLYESLLAKLSKQDGQFMGQLGDITLGDNETFTVKLNEQSSRRISAVKTIVPSTQQVIDLAFSQLQPQETTKRVEIREETFTIQIENASSKQPVTAAENPKIESTTRQEFTNQLLNAFKTSKFAQLPNGTNRLVIKLNPEHLGSLTVRLVQKNGVMIARIITSTESAKDLLDQSVHQLKQALPSIQVEIERFEVNTEQFAKTFKDNSDQKEKHEKEYHDPKTEEDQENEQSFIESLKEALNTTV